MSRSTSLSHYARLVIYKLLNALEWRAAAGTGSYPGSDLDRADGFIHFSTADQVVETAGRYFAGRRDLMLLAVDPAPLGDALRWEPSRGGELFPHLYGPLPVSAVVKELPLCDDVPVADAVARALDR